MMSLGLAFLILFLSTANIIVAVLSLINIAGIIACILAMMVLLGWELGSIESILALVRLYIELLIQQFCQSFPGILLQAIGLSTRRCFCIDLLLRFSGQRAIQLLVAVLQEAHCIRHSYLASLALLLQRYFAILGLL